MPETWVQSGTKFRRKTYLDDTEHVPPNVIQAAKLFDELRTALRHLKVDLLLECGRLFHLVDHPDAKIVFEIEPTKASDAEGGE